MISREVEAEVLRPFNAEKWRIGTIAAQLGLHHTTVQRVLRQAGAEMKTVAPRASMADPFVPFVVQQLSTPASVREPALRHGQGAIPAAPITFVGSLRETGHANRPRRFNGSRRCRASRVKSTGPTSASSRSGEPSALEAVRELAGHSMLHTTQRSYMPPARIFETRFGGFRATRGK